MKELNKRSLVNTTDTSEVGFVRVPGSHQKVFSSKLTNGDVATPTATTSKRSKTVKKAIDSDDEPDISDSEYSNASSKLPFESK